MSIQSKDLIAASTIPIILSILEKGENYGYQIIKEVQLLSEGTLDWKEGSMYPVLSKLEQKKLIKSRWIKSENGRKRKYYSLSKKGKTALSNNQKEWQLMTQIFSKLWKQENLILKS